jgi:hypothetical protein
MSKGIFMKTFLVMEYYESIQQLVDCYLLRAESFEIAKDFVYKKLPFDIDYEMVEVTEKQITENFCNLQALKQISI